jgi:hypothetical protein
MLEIHTLRSWDSAKVKGDYFSGSDDTSRHLITLKTEISWSKKQN